MFKSETLITHAPKRPTSLSLNSNINTQQQTMQNSSSANNVDHPFFSLSHINRLNFDQRNSLFQDGTPSLDQKNNSPSAFLRTDSTESDYFSSSSSHEDLSDRRSSSSGSQNSFGVSPSSSIDMGYLSPVSFLEAIPEYVTQLEHFIEDSQKKASSIYSDFNTLTAATAPLYSEALQETADANKVVIGLRDPNKMGQPLLQEGYACKGFHIKAKSSTEGPTAGFVVTEATLGKNGIKDQLWQQKMIDKSLTEGCQASDLYLSENRVNTLLTEKKMIKLESESQSRQQLVVQADYKDQTHRFILKYSEKYPETPWQVFIIDKTDKTETEKPIQGLVNKPIANETSPVGPKSIVTADYDLFCVLPTKNRDNNPTPIKMTDRLITKAGENIKKRVEQLFESQLDPHHPEKKEDPELGNVHIFYLSIMKQINHRAKEMPAGYKGGRLVHHGAENTNPFSTNPDFPLIFYVPEQTKPFILSNQKDLLAFQAVLTSQGYTSQLNPRFSMPQYKILKKSHSAYF